MSGNILPFPYIFFYLYCELLDLESLHKKKLCIDYIFNATDKTINNLEHKFHMKL